MDLSLNTFFRNNCLPLLKVNLILTFLFISFSFLLISVRNFIAQSCQICLPYFNTNPQTWIPLYAVGYKEKESSSSNKKWYYFRLLMQLLISQYHDPRTEVLYLNERQQRTSINVILATKKDRTTQKIFLSST